MAAYSFVLEQIGLPSYFAMCKIEKNSCSKVRLGNLICTITEQKIKQPPFMNRVYIAHISMS